MDNQKNSRELADEMLYNSIREKGLSHDEALLEMGRIKAQIEFDQRQYLKSETQQYSSEAIPTASYSSDTISDYYEVRSYYKNKAIKYFILLLIFGGPLIYFSIPDKGEVFDPYTIIENSGFLFLIGALIVTIGLFTVLFGNILIGGIVGLLAYFAVLDKFTVFMENQGLTTAQQNTTFGILGLIYFLIILILFIINFRNSRLYKLRK